MELILASTSPYRKAQLERLGVPFRCVAPAVDEESYKSRNFPPKQLAEELAIAKASSIADRHPSATVIGGDQLDAISGQVLGKPRTREVAVKQLSLLAGNVHELITALSVVQSGNIVTHTDIALMRIRILTQAEIERYVDADLPFDCSGAYKFESRGVALFESIQCADQSAITGLPLVALTTILHNLGFSIP